MERRTSEPGALADLFRLDHLTTRMRRHAEGLIILSGAVPGRGWRDPVPVVDILRAAVAEVEDYVRVDVTSESDDLVAGNAVSDVTHLIAELVENAAVFSPPNTRIEVRAERVGTGLVAEVEDRGLGLSPDRTRRHQRAARQPGRVRPGAQRAARAVRGQPAGGPARDQGLAAPVGVRRDDGRGADAVRRGGAAGGGRPGGSQARRRPGRRGRAAGADRTAPAAAPGGRRGGARYGCADRGGGMADGTLGDRADHDAVRGAGPDGPGGPAGSARAFAARRRFAVAQRVAAVAAGAPGGGAGAVGGRAGAWRSRADGESPRDADPGSAGQPGATAARPPGRGRAGASQGPWPDEDEDPGSARGRPRRPAACSR